MDDAIRNALETDRVIDITVTGRKSGQERRKEIWFHNLSGDLYITGVPPRKRDWYANLKANPDFIFHLKGSTQADISATATPVTDEDARRDILTKLLQGMDRPLDQLEEWVEHSPLVSVDLHLD